VRRRASTAALTGLGVAVALGLAGCSTDGTAAAPARTQVPASSAAATPTADASVSACTAYAGATGNPRQVVTTSSTKPVLGPAVALVLVNFRSIVVGASVPADPPLQAAFTELVASVDDLSAQLTSGLPAGADAVQTPVAVDPARLRAALDAADALCTARGVAPKAG
jgi:hypothetical protein